MRCGARVCVSSVRKDQLQSIPKILDELSANPLKFILFIDDLSFLKDDDNFNALKAVLEGSVTAKSQNVAIYATSNRRHIIKEKFSDREGDDIHRNDTMQELASLSERFGIHVTFSKPNKDTFLHIVRHLAEENGIDMPTQELELLAERFALERSNRSARLARQFIDGLLSRRNKNLIQQTVFEAAPLLLKHEMKNAPGFYADSFFYVSVGCGAKSHITAISPGSKFDFTNPNAVAAEML